MCYLYVCYLLYPIETSDTRGNYIEYLYTVTVSIHTHAHTNYTHTQCRVESNREKDGGGRGRRVHDLFTMGVADLRL